MKKTPDDSVCFAVSLKEGMKHGLSPLDELKPLGRHPDIRNFGVQIVSIIGVK